MELNYAKQTYTIKLQDESPLVTYKDKPVILEVPPGKSRTCEFKNKRNKFTGRTVKIKISIPREFNHSIIISKFYLYCNKKAPTSNGQIGVGTAPTDTWQLKPNSCCTSNNDFYDFFTMELHIRYSGCYNFLLHLRDTYHGVESLFLSKDFEVESTTKKEKMTSSNTTGKPPTKAGSKNILISNTVTLDNNEHKTRKRKCDGATDEEYAPTKKAKTTGTKSKNSKKISPDPQIPLEYSLNGAPHLWAQPVPSANPAENTIYELNPCNNDINSPDSYNSELSSLCSPNTTSSYDNSDSSYDNTSEMMSNSFALTEYLGSTDFDSFCLEFSSVLDYDLLNLNYCPTIST